MNSRRKYRIPVYYRAATRRPEVRITGMEELHQIAWDMERHWLTASEWLAWIKRRDGTGRKLWNGKCWHYPLRPQVLAWRYQRSTLKVRRLP